MQQEAGQAGPSQGRGTKNYGGLTPKSSKFQKFEEQGTSKVQLTGQGRYGGRGEAVGTDNQRNKSVSNSFY